MITSEVQKTETACVDGVDWRKMVRNILDHQIIKRFRVLFTTEEKEKPTSYLIIA